LGHHSAAVQSNVHYGARKAPKLIRAYEKNKLGVFRVEGELHSSLLREHGIDQEADLYGVADAFYPKHISFVKIDWKQLRKHLVNKFGKAAGKDIFEGARERKASIQRAARYLRRKGVCNVHRFYKPLAINKDIKHALNKWAVRFEDEYLQARQRTDRSGGNRNK